MVVESYVVVHNIAKRHNVGTLARSATAFGVSELILVGRRDFNSFGSHGSTSHVRFRHFHSLIDACRFLKEKDCDICGVEITDGAMAVNQHPFKKSTAFLLGNEGTGLSAKECEICDFFVYIPQYGGGTASLNVTVAASIVLHQFGGFPERTRDGNKFIVADKPEKQGKRNYCAETADAIIEERRSRKENASNGFFEESENSNSSSNLLDALFDDIRMLYNWENLVPNNFVSQHKEQLVLGLYKHCMDSIVRRKIKLLCSRIRRLIWGRPRPKVVIKRLGKWNLEGQPKRNNNAKVVKNVQLGLGHSFSKRPIRIATFNVAMFSLAPAISKADNLSATNNHEHDDYTLRNSSMIGMQAKSANDPPKSILKSPLSTTPASPECLSKQRNHSRSNLKVSINLPDNEITLANNKLLTLMEADKEFSSNTSTNGHVRRSSVPVRSPLCFPASMASHCMNWCNDIDGLQSNRSILEVLREVDADILALQDVKAEEEKGMKPLSDLAAALGMKYVFAESWAPEYGNAILSKWPIKRWKVQKIANSDDFRNVLKATINVPWAGEELYFKQMILHISWQED
ncbi:hypothetical protein G4B88_007799 [Cannabis sativa]|uniref:tRNA/rRNA methyltransferase SpoU type domain-containing protein n=1 Tax=Cannabis sativa TaxID=3483 RepID=A0A7J6HEN9_CANSA|nr:hypothetical protein G4B88_015356 [Cannabis sativa]KAF4393813.1 hypothetical protein G4B88_007799 [Cannabis sativa]